MDPSIDFKALFANVDTVLMGQLRAETGEGEMWLFGGGDLFASLLEAGRVNRVEVTIVPILLGGGVPLLQPGGSRAALKFDGSRTYPSGMVTLSYTVERA